MPVSDARGFEPDATITTTGQRVVVMKDTTLHSLPAVRVLHADGSHREWPAHVVERDDG